MADQADDSGSNVEPAVRFREISWVGPIIVPGPVRPGHDDGDGVGPTEEVEAVDSPVSTSPVLVVRTRSTIKEAISDGRIRDSLELPKYQPPNPLGIRRASQAGVAAPAAPAPDAAAPAAAPAAPAGRGEGPPMVAEVFSFRVPSTMLRGDQTRRRGMAPYALNVVQPYPNPSGLKKRKRAAPVNLELPFPERLLKRQAREVSVSHMPDGSTMVIKALDEELQEELRAAGADAAGGQSAEAAARRFSLAEALVYRMRKIKANKVVAPAQEAGNDANQQQPQQQQVKAEVQGKGKGKDEGAALELIEVGESANGKEGNMPGEPQVAAADEAEARGGKQRVKAVKMVRNVRKTVGRYLKVTARV